MYLHARPQVFIPKVLGSISPTECLPIYSLFMPLFSFYFTFHDQKYLGNERDTPLYTSLTS